MTEVTETPVEAPAAEMPAWFDADQHIRTDNGIYERATGFFLAEDGLPHAGMARCRRLAAAGATEDPLGMVDAASIAATAAHIRAEAIKAAEAAESAAFVAEKQASRAAETLAEQAGAKGARRTGGRFLAGAGDAGTGATDAQED